MTAHEPGRATDRLLAFIERRMRSDATPGLAIVATDRGETILEAHIGVADLAGGTPLGPGSLFELGSIGKSFTALTLLRLVDEGRLALDDPIERHLPWFEVAGRTAPITLHHLLTHTSGLAAGSLGHPDARAEVRALRGTRVGGPPGEQFHYSNAGYQALGLVIAAVEGRPYRDVVRDTILAPLGMTDSSPWIHAGIRDRLVTGHVPEDDDRPWHPGLVLRPAAWITTDSADGSICTTTTDFSSYLRMLLARGATPHGRIFSADAFERFATPAFVTDAATGDAYGYGIDVAGGGSVLQHSGGMIGHYANMVADLDAGIAVGAMVNGYGAPGIISRHALALLKAERNGEPLPDDPPIDDPMHSDDATTFAGRYVGPDGTLELEAAGGALRLRHERRSVELRRATPTSFVALDPELGRALLEFTLEADRPTEVHHGVRRYRREDAASAVQPVPPPAVAGYDGIYRSTNPWEPVLRVSRRRDGIELVYPLSGWTERLHAVAAEGPLTYRPGDDPATPERVVFDELVDGRPTRLWAGAFPYERAAQDPSPWTAVAE